MNELLTIPKAFAALMALVSCLAFLMVPHGAGVGVGLVTGGLAWYGWMRREP